MQHTGVELEQDQSDYIYEPSGIKSICNSSSMQLSCVRPVLFEREFLTGYSGRRFKKDESEDTARNLKPALGFSGWYRGRTHGKLGRVDLHRESIGTVEPEPPETKYEMKRYRPHQKVREESFDCDPASAMRYDMARVEASSRGHNVERIIKDIRFKLELKVVGPMKRHLYVRSIFAVYDHSGTGLCTTENFNAALLNLGIVLPTIEFGALCSVFDDQQSGEISWMKFMVRVGAGHPK